MVTTAYESQPMQASDEPVRFESFLGGGFESAYAERPDKTRLNCLKSSRHHELCREDYRRLKSIGIHVVRESISWHGVTDGGEWPLYEEMMSIAAEEGMQVVWSLNHFDFRDGIDPFSDEFPKSFAEHARESASKIRRHDTQRSLYIIPWNEISFSSWAMGEEAWWYPFLRRSGWELKQRLVKAAIAAMDAIWERDGNVRFIHTDPLMYRKAKNPNDPEALFLASEFTKHKFQSWDMIAGRICPELGGSGRHLDILGANYYYRNQEFIIRDGDSPGGFAWWGMDLSSPHRISFADLLEEAHARYRRPVCVSEVGSHGWLRKAFCPRALDEIEDARINRGIPIVGVFAYPVIDYHEWFHGRPTNSGLWDFKCGDLTCERVPDRHNINLFARYARKTMRR